MRTASLVAALVVAPLAGASMAQENVWIGSEGGFGGDGVSFSDGNNWSFLVAPDGTFSRAVIGADPGFEVGSNPVVDVDGDRSGLPTPQLVLGRGGAYSGTLNIGTGDNLVVGPGTESSVGDVPANLVVGLDGGLGTLNASGGVLSIGNELATPTNANAASSINLSGSASVTAAVAFLDRNLTISGDGVSLSILGNVILGQAGTHTWSFGAAGPSPISVGGQLDLGGTLKIDTQGITPSVGDSYLLADSGSLINGFASIDTSDVPELGVGVTLRPVSAPGGANGIQTSLVVEQQPVLVVNRRSGEVSIQNPGASAAIPIDSYDVLSAAGALDQANWTSIASTIGGSEWREANPAATGLSELNPLSSQAFSPGTTISLGAIFQPANKAFGEDTDDIAFEFTPAGEGTVSGIVVYEGVATDTLTLNVDRTTGAAQIINGFREAVAIDTYTITSESLSLAPMGQGWSPIGGVWRVADDEAGAVSELNPLGALSLASGGAQSLGNLYDFDAAGAREDLVFEFSLPSEDFTRFGKVVFDDELTVLPQGLPGDFNNDGSVDAADYSVWRDNLGQSDEALNGNGSGGGTVVQADYALWRSQYGATTGAAAGPAAVGVPEPAAPCIALLLSTLAGLRRRGSQRRCRV
ncbi:hypothetical protein [Posidoniimonas polymericola]|uniref:hypothetical protein n=1 Tax=Posidoniimonas polymericola TaxID=2528002 RepID=UPI0011B61927|nr:hypothetical protein [Posidoniimonas polymericola]